jgi:hypothetical protein
MSIKPCLLIISFTDARLDPRVFRQALYLRDEYMVTVAALADPALEKVNFIPIVHHPAKNFFHRLWRAGTLLCGWSAPFLARFGMNSVAEPSQFGFDVVLVNDIEPLSMGVKLAQGAPVVFDAHEYYPLQYEDWFWRLFHKAHNIRLCAAYIPRCAGMTTVCPRIAQEYRKNFDVMPDVVYNTPEYHNLSVNDVSPEHIRMIHHGVANVNRCIEQMIEVMDYTDSRFSLDLYLVGQDTYIKKLEAIAAIRNNVFLRQPVPMRELPLVSNQYDIGLFLVQPTTFNLLFCLPNKFFEFIQARIGVAIGPSPEMAALVRQHDLGVIAEDFTPKAMAAKLNALTVEDIIRFKRNAAEAAKVYNAEASMKVMKLVLRKALGGN